MAEVFSLQSLEKTQSLMVLLGLVLLAANGWAQYLLWFGDQGLVRWRRTQKQAHAVQGEIDQAKERIRRLTGEILLLERDPQTLEVVARRDLGLVYPEEIIFIVSE